MVIDSKGFEPDIKTVVSIIRELEPEFISRNIKLAIENHDRFKAIEFRNIIEGVASDNVGICLDSVNSMGAGEGFYTVAEILFLIQLIFISRISRSSGCRIKWDW